jgi:hypothetical protein
LNKCLIRNKKRNETLLVKVSNSTLKNIFLNGMLPKLNKTKRPTIVWDIYFGPIAAAKQNNNLGNGGMATEAMDIGNLTFHSVDVSVRRATMILSGN